MKILVIDDDESCGRSIQMLLERRHHIVDLYNSGKGAIEYAEKLRPDLTITDHNLGYCDKGLKIASHLIGVGQKAILMSSDNSMRKLSEDMGVPFIDKLDIRDKLDYIESLGLSNNKS